MKATDIESAVISAINNLCHCDLTADRITEGVFKCFPESPQAVTYRAFIHGATHATSYELIMQVERWIAGEPSIVVHRVLMAVDKACVVAISSFVDEECLPRPTSPQSPIKPQNKPYGSVIAGAIVATTTALVTIGIGVLIIVCVVKSHQRQRNR